MHRSLRFRRALPALLLLGALVAVAGACTSSASSAGAPRGAPAQGAPSHGTGGAAASPGATAAPGDEQGAGGTGSGNGNNAGNGGTGGNAARAPFDQSKIVRTGSVELEVANLDEALVKAHAAVTGLGGYIGASQQTSGPDRQVASITYRIPAGDWDAAVIALKKLGTLVTERTDATEVGGQIVDLEARIRNLTASEERVRGYMADAQDVDVLLQLETRLTDIRGQIEALEAQRVHLEDQATYGTLTVLWTVPAVSPQPTPVPTPETAWNPGAEAAAAWSQLVEMGQALGTFLIWVGIVVMPVALVFVGIAAALALLARRLGLLPARPPRAL